MDDKQRRVIRVRLALRTLAFVGMVVIAAQIATYSYLAKQEVAGTLWYPEALEADGLSIAMQRPNTWSVQLTSTSPEIRIELTGPAGVAGQLVASKGTLAALPVLEEADLQKLPERVHKAMASRLLTGYSSVKEDAPELATALETPGLVSFFDAKKDGLTYRGVRYSWVDNDRAWGLVLASPDKKWEESVPVFSRITGRLKVTPR